MPLLGTQASGYFEPPVYSLAQTFNASGNYTIPAGKTSLSVVGVGAGGGGGGTWFNFQYAGAGGASGTVAIIEDIPVSGGNNYVVTIGDGGTAGPGSNSGQGAYGGSGQPGGAGGSSSFGNLVTFNGGGGANYHGDYGWPADGAPNAASVSYNAGTLRGSSNNGGTVNTVNAQISSYSAGGNGGAGATRNSGSGPGGAGGSPYGGSGGYGSATPLLGNGSSGDGGNGPGGAGGGGGGHGDGYGPNSGGAGYKAQILVYVK